MVIIRFIFALLVFGSNNAISSDVHLSGFSRDGAEAITAELEWLKGYTSENNSRDIESLTGVDIRNGEQIYGFINKIFPLFLGDLGKPTICDKAINGRCLSSGSLTNGFRPTMFNMPGSPISLWVPYADSNSLGFNPGYVAIDGASSIPVSKLSDSIIVFDGVVDFRTSPEARAIIDTAYLFAFAEMSNSIAKNKDVVDKCDFSINSFKCNNGSEFGFFSIVSKLISEFSQKCESCTKDDYLVLSYLFTLNALSAPGNEITIKSGVEALKRNEREYLLAGLRVGDLKYRYHYYLTK